MQTIGAMMSIKSKLIFLLAAVMTVAITCTSIINYKVSRKAALKELTTSALPLTRDTIYSEILKHLMQPLHVSSLMANDMFLKEWSQKGEEDPGQVIRFLKGIHDKYGFFSTFFVSSKTSNYYHHTGVLKQVSEDDAHDVWFYTFVNSGMEYDLDVDTNQAANNTLTIFINFRMEDAQGKSIGVTGVGLKLDAVAGIIKDTQAIYQRRIYLTDTRGVIQAHMDPSLVENVDIHDLPGIGDVADTILDAGKHHVDLSYDNDSGTTLLTSRYIPELNWFLIVEQDERAVLGAARSNLLTTVGIGVLVSCVIIAIVIVAVNHFQGRLEDQAMRDELTGCLNRRALDAAFARASARFARQDRTFVVILMDVDGFKQINDHFGHLAGDEVLKAVAHSIRESVRPLDALFRFGGDEFLLLAECPPSEAQQLIERLEQSLMEHTVTLPGGRVAVSIGMAVFEKGATLDRLLAEADRAMYCMKQEKKGMSC